MPTFLPFLRAVKTPAASLLVCASILGVGVNCSPRGVPHTAPGPATGPLPNATVGVTKPPSPVERASAAGASDTPSDAGALPSASLPPTPLLAVDLPYPVDARPRAQDPAQAAAEDEELARWNVGGSSDPNAASSQASFHPGTRVVVDTRPAKRRAGAPALPAPRGLTYQRVLAQARSRGYWPFRLCFERGQRDKPTSASGQRDKPALGGETRVAFTIGTRGKVTAARLLDSKLGNASTAACMVREVNKLEFSPAPASKLRMVAMIQVYPGDAELPVAPDPAVVAALPRGDFDPEVVRARVTEKQAELDACFADARRADPALWGRLALSVILEIDGSVHRISEVESHFPSATATRCAQVVLSSVVFPSVNGKPFSFVIPLRLSPNTVPQTTTGPDENPSPPDAPVGVDSD
ncbi:MAG TPA: hypothetical protein VER04_20365 [Polyangiaceae bacterium]|nr:hypothetical protein [Polyangiaceae bacterium]